MALQALARYGAATYSPEGVTTVTVTSLGGLNLGFTVNQQNRLLLQEEKLSEIPGEYSIQAQGESCVLAQVRPEPEPPEPGPGQNHGPPRPDQNLTRTTRTRT